ncbi:MAG: hypothetical protein KDD51_13700 [Bdellovibrionales bacterium]|nr:hypothetical protein [Bdellovibrionales bacterium]
MKLFFLGFLLASSAHAFYELKCDGNFQQVIGDPPEKVLLQKVDSPSFGDAKYAGEVRGFSFEVIVHRALDTFYMTILDGDKRIAFSTARMPTFDHNDTMLDITLADGSRRWISCAYQKR